MTSTVGEERMHKPYHVKLPPGSTSFGSSPRAQQGLSQLTDLHGALTRELKVLEEQSNTLSEKRLEAETRILEALSTCLHSVQAPLNLQKSILLDMLDTINQLIIRHQSIESRGLGSENKSESERLVELVQRWNSQKRPAYFPFPSLKEVLSKADRAGASLESDGTEELSKTPKDQITKAKEETIQGSVCTDNPVLCCATTTPEGRQLRQSLGLSSKDSELILGESTQWQLHLKGAYQRMLGDLHARHVAEIAELKAKFLTELKHQEQEYVKILKHHEDEKQQLRSELTSLRRTGDEPKVEDSTTAMTELKPRSGKDLFELPLPSTTPLTMDNLVTALSEFSQSRESEARLQLYRLQQSYEEKLESLQVRLHQQDSDYWTLLQQMKDVRQQLSQNNKRDDIVEENRRLRHLPCENYPVVASGQAPKSSMYKSSHAFHLAQSPGQNVQKKQTMVNSPHRVHQIKANMVASPKQPVRKSSTWNRTESHQEKSQENLADHDHSQIKLQARGGALLTPNVPLVKEDERLDSVPPLDQTPSKVGGRSICVRGLADNKSSPALVPHSWEGLAAGRTAQPPCSNHKIERRDLWTDMTDDKRVCVRCGLNDSISPSLCHFHPGLLKDPGPLLFGPEWQACNAAGHLQSSPPCHVRPGHTYPRIDDYTEMKTNVGDEEEVQSSPAPQPRCWYPEPSKP